MPPSKAPADETPSATGVVVHVNAVTHSYSLETSSGELIVMSAKPAPALGTKLMAHFKQSKDGSYAETKRADKGHSDRTTIHGTVTFSDAPQRLYTVSAPGASILVRAPDARAAAAAAVPAGRGVLGSLAPPAPPAAPAASAPPLPELGKAVAVTVAIAPHAPAGFILREQKLVPKPPVPGALPAPIDVTGVVAAVDVAVRTVTISADDVRESGRDIVLPAAPSVDLAKIHAGKPAAGTMVRTPGKTFSLTKLVEPKPVGYGG